VGAYARAQAITYRTDQQADLKFMEKLNNFFIRAMAGKRDADIEGAPAAAGGALPTLCSARARAAGPEDGAAAAGAAAKKPKRSNVQ
jgi:hypothetical protein